MGILINGILGIPSGKVGNVIFRRRKNKVYIYADSEDRKVSQSPKAKANRNNFTFQRKLSAAMSRVHTLKYLWQESGLNGDNAFQKFMSVNSKCIAAGYDISQVKLVPSDILFNAALNNAVMIQDKLMLTVTPEITVPFSSNFYPEISVNGIMLLQEPDEEGNFPYAVIPLSSAGLITNNNIPLTFQVPIVGEELIKFDNYLVKNFVVCLIIKDPQGQPVYFSISLSGAVE